MKKMQKILWKVARTIVRFVTYLSIALIVFMSCANELEPIGTIIYVCCLAWLGLIGLLFFLEKKFGI